MLHILEGDTHPRLAPPPSTPRLPARTPDGRYINYVVSISTRFPLTQFPLNPTVLLSLCGSLYRANPFAYEATIGFSLFPRRSVGDRANVVAVADVKALAAHPLRVCCDFFRPPPSCMYSLQLEQEEEGHSYPAS